MNPLDKEEFTAFIQIIQKDMPIHTDNMAKIKCPFSQGMPKNLMEHSKKIDNEFLNSNQAIIEEVNHRDSKHWIPKWLKQYQNKTYGNSGILNHDNFYVIDPNSRLCIPQIRGGTFLNQNMMSFSNASLNRAVNGATLERVNNGADNNNINTIICTSLPTGTTGNLYDQFTIKTGTTGGGSGNIRLGLYNSIATVPTNLARESGSIAAPANNDYTPQSVTEFGLPTDDTWFAHNQNNASWNYRDAGGAGNGNRRIKAWTFGAFEDPLTSIGASGNFPTYCKISHS